MTPEKDILEYLTDHNGYPKPPISSNTINNQLKNAEFQAFHAIIAEQAVKHASGIEREQLEHKESMHLQVCAVILENVGISDYDVEEATISGMAIIEFVSKYRNMHQIR